MARYLYQPAVTKPFVQRAAATKRGRIRRSNIVVLWIVRLLALPVIVLLYVAGFVLNLMYICGSIGMILAGLGGFAAFLALLDGSYAQAAASAIVTLLLCPFAAPMLLSLAGSALIVAASAIFVWLF